MKRLFWFAVGVTVTAVIVYKARELKEKATPKGVQRQFVKSSEAASSRVADFFETARTAAAEREVELREALGMADEGYEPAAEAVRAAHHA